MNLTSQRLWRTYLKYLLLWITTICVVHFLDLQDDALPKAEGGLLIRNLNQAQLIDFNDFRAAGVVSNRTLISWILLFGESKVYPMG